MHNELESERFGSLLPEEIVCMWCWFKNHAGTFSIAWCVSDINMDDFYTSGTVVASAETEDSAKNLVYNHNIACIAMLDNLSPEEIKCYEKQLPKAKLG